METETENVDLHKGRFDWIMDYQNNTKYSKLVDGLNCLNILAKLKDIIILFEVYRGLK